MPYPNFLKPSAPFGTVKGASGQDYPTQANILRAIRSWFERWETDLVALTAAMEAAPPDKGAACYPLWVAYQNGVIEFEDEKVVQGNRDAAWAALA